MQKKTTVLLVSLVAFIVAGSLVLAFHTDDTQRAKQDTCAGKNGAHSKIDIYNNKVSNDNVSGKLCDKITFKNDDALTREIGFGAHDNHVPYDNIAQKILNQGQAFTITLDQTGTFHWHDHLHDEIQGHFTVTK